jgi:hypothetical protein
LGLKRKSHAGRRPAGPFTNNTSQLTIRMPDDLRAELQEAADKKGWSLTQELLFRAGPSYRRHRDRERQSPATRALCYLINTIAMRLDFFDPANWHRSPFAFRAFRIGVAKLLEALQPPGDDNPYESYFEALRAGRAIRVEATAFFGSYKTPEVLGEGIAMATIEEFVNPRILDEDIRAFVAEVADPRAKEIARFLQDFMYGMSDARRDLGIQQP